MTIVTERPTAETVKLDRPGAAARLGAAEACGSQGSPVTALIPNGHVRRASHKPVDGTLDSLLIYRVIIFNACGLALVAWAWELGLVGPIFESDVSRLTYVIAAVFAFGLVGLMIRTLKVSRLIDAVKRGERPNINGAKIAAKNAFLSDITEALVTLGLLGTFTGIWIAFSSVEAGSLTTASAVAQAVPEMLGGIKVAIGTTLVGGFLGLWMFVNNRMLKTATVLLAEDGRC